MSRRLWQVWRQHPDEFPTPGKTGEWMTALQNRAGGVFYRGALISFICRRAALACDRWRCWHGQPAERIFRPCSTCVAYLHTTYSRFGRGYLC
jgi:hypothetical protein